MDGKSWVLRAGEYLVGRAARYLPRAGREQRHQEWSAELPVILHDPTVRPAARRAARMLWFAADTLRGAVVARNTSGGRHVHRDAAGKPVSRMTHEGLIGLVILLTLPISLGIFLGLLAGSGYLLYESVTGATVTTDVVFLLPVLTGLFARLAWRRPVSLRFCALVAGIAIASTGQLVHGLARQFGWGHPLLFLVIGYCGQIVLDVAFYLGLAFWAKAAFARIREARAQPGEASPAP
jgi:drug/metabolite transporter (DMT)-like permease